ncbi:MAG: DUF3987 domain-containing protein [Burkholderiales bacterium]|nr:DUF3987 domain-containing protein [Burkholderiales bacterium]
MPEHWYRRPSTLRPRHARRGVAVNDAIERELREGGELADVRDAASKAADNVARLAALFQVFERGIGPVSAEAVAAASRIVGWCLSESRRFLGETALPAELANAARLDAWLRAYCRERGTQWVPRREVQRAGPARLRDGRALDEALRVLAEADRVRESSEGRRRHVIVNPRLLSGQ